MLRQDSSIFRYLTLTVKYFEITGCRKKSVPLKRVTAKRNRFTQSADAKKPFLENMDAGEAVPQKVRMPEKPFRKKYGCLRSRSAKSTDAGEAVPQKVRMPEKPFLEKYRCLKSRSAKSTDA